MASGAPAEISHRYTGLEQIQLRSCELKSQWENIAAEDWMKEEVADYMKDPYEPCSEDDVHQDSTY